MRKEGIKISVLLVISFILFGLLVIGFGLTALYLAAYVRTI